MINTISLDENYSTTRLVTKEKPEIVNNPEDKFESVLFLPDGENLKDEGGLRAKRYFKKSYENKPLISIITVVFNGEKYLEETIQSVINQTYDNVEYIIIDGGSTDGTLDIIKKYEERIDYWVSEGDKGIYDAMNKGIQLARGDVVALLNADDYYLDNNVLTNIANEFINGEKFVVTNTKILSGNSYGDFLIKKESKLHIQLPFMHPSSFISKEIYKKFGLYSLNYRVASDCDFLLRILSSQVKYKVLDIFSVVMRTGGESDFNYNLGRKEYKEVYLKYYKNSFNAYSGYYYSLAIKVYQNLKSRFLR